MTPSATLACAIHDCYNCNCCETEISDPGCHATVDMGDVEEHDIRSVEENEIELAAQALILLSSSYKRSYISQRIDSSSYQEVVGSSYQEVAGPSYQEVADPSYQEVAGPSYQEVADPSCQEIAGPSCQEIAGPSYQEVAGPSYQEVAGPSYQGGVSPSLHKKDTLISSEDFSNLFALSYNRYLSKVDIDLLPEEIVNNFFSLELLFRRLFRSYQYEVFNLIFENEECQMRTYILSNVTSISMAINNILNICIDNMTSMKAIDEFIKHFYIAPETDFNLVTDKFLLESNYNLLKEELESVPNSYSKDIVEESLKTFKFGPSVFKKLRNFISCLAKEIFDKCTSIFLKLIISSDFLKKLFFKKVSWFDIEIFFSVPQNIIDLNRKLFCEVGFLENRYLISIIMGARLKHKHFTAVNAEIDSSGLMNAHAKNLEQLFINLFKKDVIALRPDGVVVSVDNSIIPQLIMNILSSLREDICHRVCAKKKVFKRRFKLDTFSSNLGSNICSNMFYKELNSIVNNGSNYIGNGFRYYLMKIFSPICISIACDIRTMLFSYSGNKISVRSCVMLEGKLRSSMFDLVFSALSSMVFLDEIDNAFKQVCPYMGMNLCEIGNKIFDINLITIIKRNVIESIMTSSYTLQGIIPRGILSSGQSKYKRPSFEDRKIISDVITKSVYNFCEKIKDCAVEKEFLDFYVRNTLFTKLGDFNFSVSNVEMSKINSVKLDFLCKIIAESDKLEHSKRIVGGGKNLLSCIDKEVVDIIMPWMNFKLREIVTGSTLVLGSDGVILEVGELIEGLLAALSNHIVKECVVIAKDIISVDRIRAAMNKV
ncbi:hypothetical protein [Candidatus Ichthyocystis sparus]|nr:hypothetical protein [Candidatus Ichthyocystis sparus]